MTDLDWLNVIDDDVLGFLKTLSEGGEKNEVVPCHQGVSSYGRALNLGFICFAIRIQFIFGGWEKISEIKKKCWIESVRGYQTPSDADVAKRTLRATAFLDPALVEYLDNHKLANLWAARRTLLDPRQWLKSGRRLGATDRAVFAETKQALATLRDVGASAPHAYTGIPYSADFFCQSVKNLDWSVPWAAGGQAAILCFLAASEIPKVKGQQEAALIQKELVDLLSRYCDSSSGAYCGDNRPQPHGMLVNGAMKVITGLRWLGQPIHHPRALVDTVLAKPPDADGCHIVDAIYTLYECAKETDYKTSCIQDFMVHALGEIKKHKKPDGGFSYYRDRAQTSYYGVPVSVGLCESDIHGTMLLSWATVMAARLIGQNKPTWRLIQP